MKTALFHLKFMLEARMPPGDPQETPRRPPESPRCNLCNAIYARVSGALWGSLGIPWGYPGGLLGGSWGHPWLEHEFEVKKCCFHIYI